jgi:hypothetical protein
MRRREQRVYLLKDRPRNAKEFLPSGRRLNAPARPVEDGHPNRFLKLTDTAA